MYCKNCGTKLDNDANFCAKCGQRIIEITKKEKVENENPVSNEKNKENKKSTKKNIRLFPILLLLFSLGVFIFGLINLYDLYEYYQFRTTPFNDVIYIEDTNLDIKTNSEGTEIEGNLNISGEAIAYDSFYDDDTTQDGYNDRRTYYLAGDMTFVSWDENSDGYYELSMSLSDGLYVDTQYYDKNNDGNIDEISEYNEMGEAISINDMGYLNTSEVVQQPSSFIEVLYIQDILLIVIPLILIIISLITLVKSNKKNKTSKRLISLFLCSLLVCTLLVEYSYASNNIYNEDGSINQEVFDKEWMKYSDIDEIIPFNQKESYASKEYAMAEQEIERLYSQLYKISANQELNRLNYIDLANYKKAIVSTHRKNLIKTTIRLAAFTSYTVNDSIGKGKTFANDILKSGATFVTQIGDVLSVTSDFVTENYKESFTLIEKAYKYGSSDSITKAVIDDIKGEIKTEVSSKIDALIDEAVDRKRVPDYTVDDLKISKDDISILKSHYEMNRKLDNAILENRKVNSKYQDKIDEIGENLTIQLKKLEESKLAEKERIYYKLLNAKKDSSEDDEESIGLLDETTENIENDTNDTEELIELPEESIENTQNEDEPQVKAEDIIVGKWKGIYTITDVNLPEEQLTADEIQQMNSFIGQTQEVEFLIEESGNGYQFVFANNETKFFWINENKLEFKLNISENFSDGDYFRGDLQSYGEVNPLRKTLHMTMVIKGSGRFDNEVGNFYLEAEFDLNKVQ